MNRESKEAAKILIVEDNPTNMGILFDLLEQAGFQTLMALDGKQGLFHAKAALPDLILLDILMPEMDGFETCRKLKADPRTAEIPVIFITALSEIDNKLKGFALGAADYITKPFHHEEVISRVKTHLTLQKQRRDLESLNASKDRLLSIIGHDLKNPINFLMGMSQILSESENGADEAQMREFVRDTYSVSSNVLALLDNLLCWARSQTGELKPAPEIFDLQELVRHQIMICNKNAEQKEIRLKNDVPRDFSVYMDMDMAETMIRNLLSNAVKFTDKGGEIRIFAAEAGDLAEVSVADTGVGIPPEHHEKLFSLQEEKWGPGTAGEQGTGLGLILCKEFVEKNGGRIWCDSKEGEGTTFCFTVPRSAAPQP